MLPTLATAVPIVLPTGTLMLPVSCTVPVVGDAPGPPLPICAKEPPQNPTGSLHEVAKTSPRLIGLVPEPPVSASVLSPLPAPAPTLMVILPLLVTSAKVAKPAPVGPGGGIGPPLPIIA